MEEKFCKFCGAKIPADAIVCSSCGRQVEELKTAPVTQTFFVNATAPFGTPGQKNKWIALALCFFFGALGVHRFYEGKIGTGILWLCTLGLLGVGALTDFILIIFKPNPYTVVV